MTSPRAHELTELWCELQKQGLAIGVSCVVIGSLVLLVMFLMCVVAHEDLCPNLQFCFEHQKPSQPLNGYGENLQNWLQCTLKASNSFKLKGNKMMPMCI